MSEIIKVMIVDDHTIFRQGLTRLLEGEGIRVVGQASSGQQALDAVGELCPDIVLMDIKMPGMDGIEAMELIKKSYPEVDIVVLSMYEDAEYVVKAIKAGASGYMQKSISAESLIESIRGTYSGQKPLVHLAVESEVLQATLATTHEKRRGLTDQEMQVLQLMAQGNSNKQIAQHLFVSHQTVKGYVHNILGKLDASDRTQAVAIAVREGLVK